MKCYYHNDLDGRCAGAIVFHSVSIKEQNREYKSEMIELDYKDEIEIEKILPNEQIWIVDFSFKPEIMEEVFKKTTDIVWIDHHKTADEYKYSRGIKGLRITEDKKFSGCELTWQYVHPDLPMPRAVELIGDRDKWAWKFGDDTAWFNQAIKLYDHKPTDEIWITLLFSDKQDKQCKSIMVEGSICLKFRDSICKDYCDHYGFETKFEGYKCFANGIYMFGSEGFGDRFKKYDICISYEFTSKNWIVGLYSTTIDVGEIAKKYGGGGHKGASGFVCKELPF